MTGAESTMITDPSATLTRRHQLLAYYDRAVLGSNGFVCTSHARCAGSVARPGIGFSEGQLSYLGEHYDTRVNGTPLRVAIVPMEFGAAEKHVTMDRFAEVIAERRDGRRNPHMRGVAFALRLAFGLGLGDDRGGEYLTTPGGRVHMFDAYAMVNSVLCAAAKLGTNESRQSATMRTECSRHLTAALRILAPTLVISQGALLSLPLSRLFTIEQSVSDVVSRCSLDIHRFVWVNLHHPTRHWDSLKRPYLRNVVEPSITHARHLVLGSTQ